MDLKSQLNKIISMAESEENVHELLEDVFDDQQKGLDSINNPFQSWATAIYD